jgi:hypothetical protein
MDEFGFVNSFTIQRCIFLAADSVLTQSTTQQLTQSHTTVSETQNHDFLCKKSDFSFSSLKLVIGIFLFPRPVLGSTQSPIQWIPRVKRPGREAEHLSQTSAEAKNTWIYTFTPSIVFMAQCLIS